MNDHMIRRLDSALVEAMSRLDDANHILIAAEYSDTKHEFLAQIRTATDAINSVLDKIAEVAEVTATPKRDEESGSWEEYQEIKRQHQAMIDTNRRLKSWQNDAIAAQLMARGEYAGDR
jgi:hypothetical protein